MKLKKTHFISLIFILIFIISAPMVIFYASGWRYDFKRKNITKTGSFSLNSFPSGAEVYLDNKLQGQNFFRKFLFYKIIFKTRQIGGLTPTLIKNLIPDDYLVEIKKENYHSWKKKLTIEREKTTVVKNVDLFLKQPKIELLVERNIIEQKISPDQRKIAYLIKEKNNFNLEVIDLKNRKITLLYQSPLLESLISWSPSNENILVREKSGNCLIISLYNPNIILSLKTFLPAKKNFTNLKWKNNLILLGTLEKNLYQINLAQKTAQIISEMNGNDYLIRNNSLYQFKNIKDQTYLEEINLSSKENYLITSLPYADDYKFLNFSSNLISLINERNNSLFLIDPQIRESSKNIILKTEVKHWEFDPFTNQLLYNNDFEISIFDLKKKKKEIITRYSQEIKKALFYHLGYSIIFSLEDSLYTLEVDKRDRRNFIELLKVDEIDDFFIANAPKILYLIGEIKSKKGLFKIQIQ